MSHVGPFSEIRLCDFLRSKEKPKAAISAHLALPNCQPPGRGKGEGGGGGQALQFFPSLKMFVVVEKIGPPFSPCAVVYAAIFTRLGGFGLPEGAGERFRGGFFIGWRFGGGGGRRWECGCVALWPLEKRLAGGAEPLG